MLRPMSCGYAAVPLVQMCTKWVKSVFRKRIYGDTARRLMSAHCNSAGSLAETRPAESLLKRPAIRNTAEAEARGEGRDWLSASQMWAEQL